ncbi:hypothetical protein DFH09DRAFT_1077829 [Mycena vulgaris]|nr:hypothetical protein DFH09DRAFT_1077829 [Mycena vulgaris]
MWLNPRKQEEDKARRRSPIDSDPGHVAGWTVFWKKGGVVAASSLDGGVEAQSASKVVGESKDAGGWIGPGEKVGGRRRRGAAGVEVGFLNAEVRAIRSLASKGRMVLNLLVLEDAWVERRVRIGFVSRSRTEGALRNKMCERDASEWKKGGRLDEGSGTRGCQFQYAVAVPGLRERGDEAREYHTGAQLQRARGSLKGESRTTEKPKQGLCGKRNNYEGDRNAEEHCPIPMGLRPS